MLIDAALDVRVVDIDDSASVKGAEISAARLRCFEVLKSLYGADEAVPWGVMAEGSCESAFCCLSGASESLARAATRFLCDLLEIMESILVVEVLKKGLHALRRFDRVT